MLSGCLYVRCFRHVLLRGGPGADTGHTAEIVSLGWHNNISVSHNKSWSRWLGEVEVWHLCLDCCPCDWDCDEQQKMQIAPITLHK